MSRRTRPSRLQLRQKQKAPKARLGAARSLPIRVASRMPVVGRAVNMALPAPPPPPPPKSLPRKLISGASNLVRQPFRRSASAVQIARDIRRPSSRSARLRQAVGEVLGDPGSVLEAERYLRLGLGLAAGRQVNEVDRKRLVDRALVRLGLKAKPKPEKKGLRQRLVGVGSRALPGAKKNRPSS